MDQPLRCVELNLQEFATSQGGDIQTYELLNPAMRLYSNGASKPPLNIRAIFILWAHNRELAYRTTVTGPALLTGNNNGADADVPDEIMGLIFKAQCYEVAVDGKGTGLEELPFSYAATMYESVPSVESEVSLTVVIAAKCGHGVITRIDYTKHSPTVGTAGGASVAPDLLGGFCSFCMS